MSRRNIIILSIVGIIIIIIIFAGLSYLKMKQQESGLKFQQLALGGFEFNLSGDVGDIAGGLINPLSVK